MKRIFFVSVFFMALGLLSAVPFSELKDDFVVVNVGKSTITALDVKKYVVGYKSITDLDKKNLEMILDTMINDHIFMNACLDEGITVNKSELYFYTEYYFNKINIDLNNENAVLKYFETTDPYSDLDDFFLKSTFFLLKSKYLCIKKVIDKTMVSHIFFSKEKKSSKEIEAIRSNAKQTAYMLADSDIPFTEIFKRFSDGMDPNTKNGDIGECSASAENIYIPSKDVYRVISAGLFSPVFVENKKGYSILFNTTYAIPDVKKLTTTMDELYKKYPVKINITF